MYKITITRITDRKQLQKGDWTIVDQRPWTAEEVSEETRKMYGESARDILKEKPLKQVYGYTPDREVVVNVETEVLKQTVETLDLAAVIKAVNGL